MLPRALRGDGRQPGWQSPALMHPLAVAAVLLAAFTHATWNLAAKRAAGSRHFVWLYSLGSVILYAPAVLWIVIYQRPQFEQAHWLALLMTGVLHMGYSLLLQAGYRVSDLSLVYPLARGTGPLLSFVAATFMLNEPANPFSTSPATCCVWPCSRRWR